METETLLVREAANFAEIYYDFAAEDHFWVRNRFDVLLRAAQKFGLDPGKPMLGFDIGCGEGAVQRQLIARTAWRADGCELNRAALAKHSAPASRVLYYDITERRPDLCEHYQFLILFDVIEHVERTAPFLRAAAYHLKPAGHILINVPAGPYLYSRYDSVQGHYRRYDKALLQQHLTEAGLIIETMHYWGWSLLPVALARKFFVDRKQDDADTIMRTGFNPPNRFASALLSSALAIESLFPPAPIGTSLLAIARKPG